jgi:hypothetical protein
MAVVTYTAAGVYTWLCPSGVRTIKAECWGAGGGGQAASGGGGGGAAYACEPSLAVTPGKLYTFTVAAGGAGAPYGYSITAGFGGTSVFAGDQVVVLAAGGYGAPVGSVTFPGGAGAPAGANTVAYAGGAGGSGNASGDNGGGGGGSAGDALAGAGGGNATSSLPGLGAPAAPGGGPGGNGGSSGNGSAPASGPGGGGGGGASGSGAAGAAGQVQLTYTVASQPAIPTFVAGYSPLPSDFDSWIQAPFSFLTSKVVFRAELSSALTLTNNADVLIPYNVIDEDPYAGWQSATSSWLCPAGCTGTYEVSVTVSMAAGADATSSLTPQLWLNGVYVYALGIAWVSATQATLACGSAPIQLYGGQDEISVYANLVSSASEGVVTTAGQRCTVEVTWLSL